MTGNMKEICVERFCCINDTLKKEKKNDNIVNKKIVTLARCLAASDYSINFNLKEVSLLCCRTVKSSSRA